MMAYLTMMAPRLLELARILKSTGSIYLHCDATASHYLKILMDAVFEPRNFRNEIIWKRTSSHNDAKRFAEVCDCIFYYGRLRDVVWNPQYQAHNEQYLRSHYNRQTEEGRPYRLDNIIRSASMGPRPNLVYEYKGFTPPWGWRVVLPKLKAIDESGRLMWVKGRRGEKIPYLIRFLDEQMGAAMPALWDDIPPINSQAQERLRYPTQKPEALLERIIKASSNEGDVVLDPFCGCGTAIAVAQRLKRNWIGIDITHLAIGLIKHRLWNAFENEAVYKVIGEPVSLQDAAALAEQDPYQFQWWALGLVHARREDQQRKGRDRGIDGRLYFHDEVSSGKTKQIIFSVKSGRIRPTDLRDLRGVLDRESAEIGVFITLQEPTRDMKREVFDAGFYDSPGWNKRYPRLQILTIKELLEGKNIDYPPSRQVNVTFKRAPRAQSEGPENLSLL